MKIFISLSKVLRLCLYSANIAQKTGIIFDRQMCVYIGGYEKKVDFISVLKSNKNDDQQS